MLLGVLAGIHFLGGELVDVGKGAAVRHWRAIHRTSSSLHVLLLLLLLLLLLQVHLLDLLPIHRVHRRGQLRLQASILVHVRTHQGQAEVCHDYARAILHGPHCAVGAEGVAETCAGQGVQTTRI